MDYNFMLRQSSLSIDPFTGNIIIGGKVNPPPAIVQDITPETHKRAEEMLKKIKEENNHGKPIPKQQDN